MYFEDTQNVIFMQIFHSLKFLYSPYKRIKIVKWINFQKKFSLIIL